MVASFKAWLLKEESGELLQHIKINLPSAKQQGNFTCGAACLRSISSYYKVGPETECDFVKAVKATKQDGTEPDNLVKAAKAFGLNAVVKEGMSIKELKAYIDKQWPVICNIQAWGDPKQYKKLTSGHYVIAIGYDDKHLYFEDPSMKGNRGKLTCEEFEERWNDKQKNGEKTRHLGIVIWQNKQDTNPQYLVKAKKVQ